MDTLYVETFLVAVDNGSIAEAARRLNVTPAAAAKRIRSLETEVGAVLVRRFGRTIKPTEAGVALIERAKRFLSEARDFKSIAAIDRPSGQLRLGAFQSALTGLLPDILVLMERAYPQIDVSIARGTSAQLYRRLLDGDDLDAASFSIKDLPNRFTLWLDKNGKVQRECKVMWAQAGQVGVRFEGRALAR